MYGPVEQVSLNRIQRFAADFLTRSWTTIPHVTHHDEADISAVEEKRQRLLQREPGTKLSLLPFLIKATVAALREHPRLNAALDASGTGLWLKKYFHIGVAVDTPAGLLVAVLRDCDRKDLLEIAGELQILSGKARDKGLTVEEMSGGCFTISSLGHIGGTGFSPIINTPEVAILGVSRAEWKPTRGLGDQIDWRLMLPLSLSYDHRAVNGADAARFMRSLAAALAGPWGP
jgi:pyruvate dehydrogenase E2 component (dihydrolipoamide acetyltransferase)